MDWVREYVGNLDILQSMGLDGIHPWVARELADTITRPLTISLKGHGDQFRCLRTGREQISPQSFVKGKKDPGNY